LIQSARKAALIPRFAVERSPKNKPASSWRPIYAIKIAANDALDGLANYADVMLAFIFEIPVALLWIATVVLCSAGA
jgi:hypothetical protein